MTKEELEKLAEGLEEVSDIPSYKQGFVDGMRYAHNGMKKILKEWEEGIMEDPGHR